MHRLHFCALLCDVGSQHTENPSRPTRAPEVLLDILIDLLAQSLIFKTTGCQLFPEHCVQPHQVEHILPLELALQVEGQVGGGAKDR